MKQLKIFSAGAVALLMIFSCNSGSEEKTTDTTSSDTTTVQKQPEAKPVTQYVLLIRQKVANFAKWFAAYEGRDSARLAYGLHNFVISRGTKDSNTVMVALRMDDTAKGMQYTALPDLKTAMQKAGVIGTPTFWYMENQWRDTTTNSSLNRVMVNHKVKDWDAWKKAFDNHKQARMDAGLTDRAVSHAVGDPHWVSVVMIVNDMKKAEDFMKSKDLKDKMAEAGVEGVPDIWFYHAVKQY